MSGGYLCRKKNRRTVKEDEVRRILQPFVVRPLPEDLAEGADTRLKTGEPFSFWVRTAYLSLRTGRRTPGLDAVLRALADAGFTLFSDEVDAYIDPYTAP